MVFLSYEVGILSDHDESQYVSFFQKERANLQTNWFFLSWLLNHVSHQIAIHDSRQTKQVYNLISAMKNPPEY